MTDQPKKTLSRPLRIGLGVVAVVVGLLMFADGIKTLFG
jgi:hypothetical protein